MKPVLVASTFLLLVSWSAIAGSRQPSPYIQIPRRAAEPLTAEVQTDDFSCGYQDGKITIADSLQSEVQMVPLDDLASGPLLSTILLTPHYPQPGSPYHRAHASGGFQMFGTLWASSSTGMRVFLLLLLASLVWLLKATTRRVWRFLRRSAKPTTSTPTTP